MRARRISIHGPAGRRPSASGARRTAPLLLATALAASSCAHAGVMSQGSCVSSLDPAERPLDEVVDSVALGRAVAASWPQVGSRVVASLVYDSLGAVDAAQVWSTSLSDSARARLEGVLTTHARVPTTAGQRVHLFLGDERGPRPRRVRELRGCPPRMLNPERLATRLSAESRSLRITQLTRVDVFAFVQPDGRPIEVRVEQSSGNPAADEAARRIIFDAVFMPAMIEGVPIPLWAHFPVTFRVAR